MTKDLPHPAPAFQRAVPDRAILERFRLPWLHPSQFFGRLLLDDLESISPAARPTVLDIGCGGGLQGIPDWQWHIAARAGEYIGVEPDQSVQVAGCFSQVIRDVFEDSGLLEASVDLAYSAMVIEHVRHPDLFFAKLAETLRPGGVFWAFTVDRRHYFSWMSQLMEALRLKDRYLDRVRGRRGASFARYENFPTCYRCNTPAALERYAGDSFTLQTWSLHRIGQLDGYVPYRLRRFSRLADRMTIRARLPGSLLVARMVRL